MSSYHHNHANHSHHLSGKKLLLSIVLNVLITVAQVIGGLLSGSLSLLSDALHNFSDVVSLILSYIANRFSQKEASLQRTFGYKRAEIIAAFVNAASLIIIAIFLMIEAIERFADPQKIGSGLVIWMSILGIVANGLSVLLLKKEHSHNMNMKSAYLHLLTDMMASVAVLVGGILMYYFDWFWVDSLLTMAISFYLIIVGYDLLKSSFKVLMLFTPDDINLEDLVTEVRKINFVKNMHHIHIWQLNEQEVHLEAHIDFTEDISLSHFESILESIEQVLQENGINHINIQPEFQKIDNKDIIVQD